jgi:autotransporter-associated beta strand protein
LIKAGNGTLRLTAANTFSRPVNVMAGTLLVNGSLTSGSSVMVAPGATLGGTGVLNGAVTNNGTLTPGNFGIGRLTINNSLLLSGTTVMEISKTGGVRTNDLASVSGMLTQGGMLVVTNLGPAALAAGDSFKLFNAGTWAGGFANVSLPPLASDLVWDASALATSGTILVVAAPQSIPPGITGLGWSAGAGFSLTATGGFNEAYVLLATTNLSPATWLPLKTNQADDGGAVQFADPDATNHPQRFYRLGTP